MKRICFFLVFALFSTGLIGQTTIEKAINKWNVALIRVSNLYPLTACEKGQQDALLKEAHDSLMMCKQYTRQVAALNNQYMPEVNIRDFQSMTLFSLYYQRPCAAHIFTTKEALSWIKTLESNMPDVKRIVLADLKLDYNKITQSLLDEIQCNAFWESFSINLMANDTTGMSKAMHRYIAWLRKKYTDPLTFCSSIYNDTTMSREWVRLKELFSSTNYDMWGEKELDYSILEIELEAEEFLKKQPSAGSGVLNSLKRMSLLQKLLIIELGMDLDKPEYVLKQFDELTRLKEATRKLELNDMYQKVYTALVGSTRCTDEDRWKYLEAMTQLFQSAKTNEDLMDNIQSDVTAMCNRLYDGLTLQEGFEEQYTRLQPYYTLAGNNEGVRKCKDALAAIETMRQKREKKEAFQQSWGLSVGFAPIKTLFFGGKQASFFADFKTFGLSHGVRYCRFDGFTDNYRFYAWLINDDKPGGAFTYSGYEASYWISLFSMREDFVQQRLCLEYRYGNYAFEPLSNVTLLNRSTDEVAMTGETVNPVGINKDVTLVYRLQLFVGSRFFIEGNVGLGLGYRSLKAGQDLDVYEIDNDAYNDATWNRLTLPGRVGLRCGIKLF